jgi:hypothetical protein
VLLEQAAEKLFASHPIGRGYRYTISRATVLAMRGSTDEAAAALEKVQRRFRRLDHEHSLARAWVAAGRGGVTEAIQGSLSAAERAAAKGQFAAEVLCLQTAAQFGDRTGARRLHELESVVEGPRVGVRKPVPHDPHATPAVIENRRSRVETTPMARVGRSPACRRASPLRAESVPARGPRVPLLPGGWTPGCQQHERSTAPRRVKRHRQGW